MSCLWQGRAGQENRGGSNRRCRIAGRTAGCSKRTACTCPGYPRHALCLARARYCTTPHRNFDGLASLLVFCPPARLACLPAWEGDGLDAWSGSPVALFSCGSLAPVPHCSMLLNSPCAWFLAQVPGSGSLQQGRSRNGNGRVWCILPRPDPDVRVLSFWSAAKDSGVGRRHTHKKEESRSKMRGGRSQERG